MHNRHLAAALKRILNGVALVILGLIIVLLILWSIDSNIIQPAFQRLEQQQADDDSRRVQSAIENEFAKITILANDWAVWDDTYAFAENGNSAYIASVYPDPAIMSKNSQVDLLAIYNSQGRQMLYGNFSPDEGESVAMNLFSGDAPAIVSLIAPVLKDELSAAT